jgi:YjbE family integral membrane protein
MVQIYDPVFWASVAEIVVINLLLSGDNAVVIALACRHLPPPQRRLGIAWGVAGAVVLRVLLTFFVVGLLTLPYLKLAGAVLLVWIGVKLIAEEPGEGPEVNASDRLWSAIYTVIVADLVMSLDNVIGVASAAHGNLALLVFGLALSIPIVMLGSQLVLRLFAQFPLLIVAGGGLLGYVAGDLAIEDPALGPYAARLPAHIVVALCGAIVVVVSGSWLARRRAAPAEPPR